ncbi:ribosomal-processing cysteine protease Prp [Veillonella caviae]|uniref:ribosomal-processing cysteine protease Prp n=1 Tax=Veillonella caviae TaxID=248316 RepID=UPI0023F78B84|nr:ribosomal-processing cysteine protease Prp [Veillonella caviae]
MVSIEIQRNGANQIVGAHFFGHAGYDEHGYDIVCAAVSVLSATTILGLTQIAQQEGEFSNAEGRCDMVLSGTITQSSQDLLKTMLLGLEEISKQYPKFVQIHEI